MASFDGRLAEAMKEHVGISDRTEETVLRSLAQEFLNERIVADLSDEEVAHAVEAAIDEISEEEYAVVVERLQDLVDVELSRQAKEIALRLMREVLRGATVTAS
jgi:hypothetical protein